MYSNETIRAKIHDVILQLKAVREQRGLSLQKILDITLANGGNVSMSTVRKVFADGSENQNYRYEDTIKPIADALLDMSAPPKENVSSAQESELEALRQIVQLKNDMLDEAKRHEEEIRADAQIKIDFLKNQVEAKDRQIAEKDDQLKNRASAMNERWQHVEGLNADIKEYKREIKEHKREISRQKTLLLLHRLALGALAILAMIGFATDKILF